MSKASKIWLITATCLILCGLIMFAAVMSILKWDFKKLSTVKCETKTFEISEDFSDISISGNTEDISFIPCEKDKAKVVSTLVSGFDISVSAVDRKLTVSIKDNREWYDNIGFFFGQTKITVYIPEGKYGNLKIDTHTGDISVPKEFSFKNVDISASTGDITLKGVTASGNINIKTSTGDITLKECDAENLFLKASTGDITGSLLTEKVFSAKTSTGEVSVPHTKSGGKCEIKTSTGDIIFR